MVVCAAILLGLPQSADAQARQSVVEVELRQFGVRSYFRPGGITPMQVALRIDPASQTPEAMPVWVQWEVPDANGDISEYGRPVTLTRGRDTLLWLYAPLLPDADEGTIWPVKVFSMEDDVRGRELGGVRLRPRDVGAQMIPITDAMIGVIGQRQMRLNDYSTRFDHPDRSPAAHERTRIISSLHPEQLPDRWQGLMAFEVIAWSDAQPHLLGTDAARALREYVRRGGHLVISLRQDANPWQFSTRGQTALDDILPDQEPRLDETVNIRDLVPILSKSETTSAYFTFGVRVFRDLQGDFDVISRPYQPLMALPDGRVVVIHRTFGHGHITISGIDLAQVQLDRVPLPTGATGLPQGDAFWNRVLGRRADTPRASELEALRDADLLSRPPSADRDLGAGGLFSQQIAMSTQAGVGLLLALILFATYWVITGPGGFGLLRLYKKAKHAWVAFAGAAIVFTGIAWASVSAIRVNEPRMLHVTFLDHIARPDDMVRPDDPQMHRAISWFSLYIPGYGQVPVSIDSDENHQNLLSSWSPPGESILPFPNADRYRIDVARSPDAYSIVSRSTTTLMYANWLGGVSADWGGMIRAHPDDGVRVRYSPDRREAGLAGTLYHDLPGNLQHVRIIWVRNARMPDRRYARSAEDDSEVSWMPLARSGQVLNLGYFLGLGEWGQGEALDLRDLEFDPRSILDRGIEDLYVEDERRLVSARAPGVAAMRAAERRRYMEMLSMFHQLTPPDYIRPRADASHARNNAYFQRRIGRELDLSAWFNRPCLIIIGYLENSASPIPLRVGGRGEMVDSEGLTVVRWIHPLPLDESITFGRIVQNEDDVSELYNDLDEQ